MSFKIPCRAPAKFQSGDLVKHKQSGTMYRIIQGPDICRMKVLSAWFPGYQYKQVITNEMEFFRTQDDFESHFDFFSRT